MGNVQEENSIFGEIWQNVKSLKQELAAIKKGGIREGEIICGNLKLLSKFQNQISDFDSDSYFHFPVGEIVVFGNSGLG